MDLHLGIWVLHSRLRGRFPFKTSICSNTTSLCTTRNAVWSMQRQCFKDLSWAQTRMWFPAVACLSTRETTKCFKSPSLLCYADVLSWTPEVWRQDIGILMSQGCNLGWSHHLKIFASFSGGCWQCLSLSPSQKEYLRDSLLLSWATWK